MKKKENFVKRYFWLFIIFIYCLIIFLFTHSPISTGEQTLSMWERIFTLDKEYLDLINLVTRKLTHIITFGVLGWLFYRLFNREKYFLPWVGVTIYGLMDEWHQTFIDGRMGSVVDAGVNSFGAALFLFILYLLNEKKIKRT